MYFSVWMHDNRCGVISRVFWVYFIDFTLLFTLIKGSKRNLFLIVRHLIIFLIVTSHSEIKFLFLIFRKQEKLYCLLHRFYTFICAKKKKLFFIFGLSMIFQIVTSSSEIFFKISLDTILFLFYPGIYVLLPNTDCLQQVEDYVRCCT